MPGMKEIQNRIGSIKDTMKITKAMYMMSSMKLRKAKKQLENTEIYFDELQKEMARILRDFPTVQHRCFENREEDEVKVEKKTAFVIITGDKGMAGAYNHNVLKEAEKRIKKVSSYELYVVGELGRQYFLSQGYKVKDDFYYTATNPTVHRARIITESLMEQFLNEEIDYVDVIYTRMISSMSQTVKVKHLLPLKTYSFIKNVIEDYEEPDEDEIVFDDDMNEDYIYPSPVVVLERMIYDYVTGFIYGCLVESYACEENARMMAMQAATNNAEAILHDLSIEYNRVRQAAITQQITEVIGGAKALKKKKQKIKVVRTIQTSEE